MTQSGNLANSKEELSLPTLTPESRWYGYSFDEWPAELDAAAQRATMDVYFATARNSPSAAARA
jgi:hypothetical protein